MSGRPSWMACSILAASIYIQSSTGFTSIHPKNSLLSKTIRNTHKKNINRTIHRNTNIDSSQTNNKNKDSLTDRTSFLHKSITFTATLVTTTYTSTAKAFDGGVGGLGKTKPQTGVVFANTDVTNDTNDSTRNNLGPSYGAAGEITVELLAPDGTPALLSFDAPWPMMRSDGIESRDLSNPESAFVQVARIPSGGDTLKTSGNLPKSLFVETVFGPTGKYGAYGTPTDIRIRRVGGGLDDGGGNPNENGTVYAASFTTLTPAMRESERKALIATSVVGDGVFMLVVGTTAARFKSREDVISRVVKSFSCVEAPRSDLRR